MRLDQKDGKKFLLASLSQYGIVASVFPSVSVDQQPRQLREGYLIYRQFFIEVPET